MGIWDDVRERAWIWDSAEGENVDLRLYSGREHGFEVQTTQVESADSLLP